jgi:tripartite-type tricarboxylate transporter receptor subunit TctC
MTYEIDLRRRQALRACALALPAAGLLPGVSLAQDQWPSKPIRVIVPFPAGGVVDLVIRAVTDRMSQTLNQPFVVEARPGASGNIGTEAVARAPADGYTLLAATPATVTQPLLSPVARFSPTDFTAVGLIGAPPNLYVVPAALQPRTVKELVEYARARPGKLNVSNPGMGTSNHLGQELFFSVTGVEMTNVMYKGQPQMLPDLISGQLSFGLVTQALAVPHVRDGRLRALAISAPRRSPDLPDVPTIAEAGFPEAMFLPWYGIVTPAGTPPAVVKRLSDEFMAAIQTPEVVARLEKIGTQITPGSAEAFNRLLREETERWTRVIKERNIKIES